MLLSCAELCQSTKMCLLRCTKYSGLAKDTEVNAAVQARQCKTIPDRKKKLIRVLFHCFETGLDMRDSSEGQSSSNINKSTGHVKMSSGFCRINIRGFTLRLYNIQCLCCISGVDHSTTDYEKTIAINMQPPSCDEREYHIKCLKLAGLCQQQLCNPPKARPLQNNNAHTPSCLHWNACTTPTSASQITEEKHKCAILHTLCETGLTTYVGLGQHGSKSKRGIFVEFDTFSEKGYILRREI